MTEENPNSIDRLEKLAELRQKGTLTDEEFRILKSSMLGMPCEISNKQTEMKRTESNYTNHMQIHNQEFLTYENPIIGFKINYPSSWEGTEVNRDIGDRIRIIEFGLPMEKPLKFHHSYRQMLVIAISNLKTRNMPLEVYVQQRIFALQSTLNHFKLIESTQTEVSNRPAFVVVFTYEDRGYPVKLENMNIWTMVGQTVFSITYSALIEEFSNGLPTVEKMISTFKITHTENFHDVYQTNNDSKFLTYEHSDLGIKIDYPKGWIADERNFDKRTSIISHKSSTVFHIEILSPSEVNSGVYEDRLVIQIMQLSSKATLDEYVHDYIVQLIKNTAKFRQFTLLESTPVLIGHLLSKKIVYKTMSNTQTEIRTMETFVMKDNKLCILTFGGEIEIYLKYLSTVEHMTRTFAFI